MFFRSITEIASLASGVPPIRCVWALRAQSFWIHSSNDRSVLPRWSRRYWKRDAQSAIGSRRNVT